MSSAAGGVIDRSVGHSAFRKLPTVPQPTSADFVPKLLSAFRIPHFRKLPTPCCHTSILLLQLAAECVPDKLTSCVSFQDNDYIWSVLGVDRRSRTSEQKITSGRSPLYLITFVTLLM